MSDSVQALSAAFRDDTTRIALIAQSYRSLVGRRLIASEANDLAAIWGAPLAIVAHGTEDDPLFFFANAAALAAFETTLDQFIGMPSRFSAEPLERAARQSLLDRVSAQGFIDDYNGVRITAKGRRFTIRKATVWNLVDADGHLHGQAAAFTPPD